MTNTAPPGALATAAAVTPVLTVVPLPTIVNIFEPPTIILGGYGHSPFHRWWNEIPTGISILKFGLSYRQYQSPTQDDLDAADITYLGGRIYQVSNDEAAALTAAGYGVNLYTKSIPYVAPVMGGIADSGPPHVNIAGVSPPPATASAVAPAPGGSAQAIVARPASVLAAPAVATAGGVLPTSVQATNFRSAAVNLVAVPGVSNATATAPAVAFATARVITPPVIAASAAAVVPSVSGGGSVGTVTATVGSQA